MVAFAINNSELVDPIIRESISRGVQGINQAIANAPLPTVALIGGIAGGIAEGNLEGALQGAAGAVFGTLAGKLAGNSAAFVENLGFVSPAILAAGNTPEIAAQRTGNNAAGEEANNADEENEEVVVDTYAGGTNAANPAEVRTEIQDTTTNAVEYIADSFLQGVQGGLSSIAGSFLGGLLGKLPSVMGDLLSSTGLSGALGSALGAIDGAIGNALGAVSGALGDMAGKLANGLGAAISGIPGVGPVFDQFSRGIGDFAKNLSGAVNGLPTGLQDILSGAAANVGANLVGKIFNKPNITSKAGKQIAKDIIFNENPVGQLNSMASLAKQIDKKTFKTTNDPAFANMATACKRCAKKFRTKLVKKNNGFGVSVEEKAKEDTILGIVVDGQVFKIGSYDFDRIVELNPSNRSTELLKLPAESQAAFNYMTAG
jgi:hypothetical protein